MIIKYYPGTAGSFLWCSIKFYSYTNRQIVKYSSNVTCTIKRTLFYFKVYAEKKAEMNRNASFSFNLEEWEKKPRWFIFAIIPLQLITCNIRKPFNIKKTWSRNKPAVEETSGVTVENFNDDNISFVTSTVYLRSPSPPKDLTTDESHQQSSRNSIAKSSNSSTKKKTPESRELRGVLENMPSLRKSTLPARRHDESQQASSSKPPPKATKNKKKSDFAEKPIQKLSMQNQQHSGQYLTRYNIFYYTV